MNNFKNPLEFSGILEGILWLSGVKELRLFKRVQFGILSLNFILTQTLINQYFLPISVLKFNTNVE